jgi:gas vesicle protein
MWIAEVNTEKAVMKIKRCRLQIYRLIKGHHFINLLITKIMKTGSLILGLLAGACIGGIGGILFAPHKGSVTRKIMVRRGEDYVDILQEKFDDFLDTIDNKIDNVKKEVAGYIKREKVNAHEHAKSTLN